MNFLDLEKEKSRYETARVALLPVPFDKTATYVRGAARGPSAIIAASAHVELYDEDLGFEPCEAGLFTADPVDAESSSPAELADLVERRVASLLDDGKYVVTLGGEHTVSVGAIRAHAARRGPLTVVQFDAHADLRDSYEEGGPYSHACVMRRAREVAPTVHVGVRSLAVEEAEYIGRENIPVAWAHRIRDDPRWADRIFDAIGERVYLTVDVDGFDPSLIPATGTPEPGGFGWWEGLSFFRRLFAERRVVGFDVTELCPTAGLRASDFIVARLVYKLIGYRFAGDRGRGGAPGGG